MLDNNKLLRYSRSSLQASGLLIGSRARSRGYLQLCCRIWWIEVPNVFPFSVPIIQWLYFPLVLANSRCPCFRCFFPGVEGPEKIGKQDKIYVYSKIRVANIFYSLEERWHLVSASVSVVQPQSALSFSWPLLRESYNIW